MHRTNRGSEKNPKRLETTKSKPFKEIKFIVHKPPLKKNETQVVGLLVDY